MKIIDKIIIREEDSGGLLCSIMTPSTLARARHRPPERISHHEKKR